MAISTPTIDALRGERQNSIERLREGVNGNIEQLRDGTRANYEALMNDVRTLDGLKDTSFQIDDYGAERWHADFVRVSELPGGVNDPTWRRVSGSRFGRFQSIYCDPADWIAPRVPRGDLDTMPLRGCLVRGDKITDEFGLAAGFATPEEWEHFDGDPMGRLARKQEWAQPMKALFESTVPVGASKRVRRIEPRGDRTKLLYPDVPEHAAAVNGDLLLMKGKGGNGKGRAIEREAHHHRSGDSLLRMTHHQERWHGSESDFLAQCEIDLEGLIIELNERYRKGTPAEEKALLWERAKNTLARYNRRLEHCFNELKADANDFMLGAADLEYEDGRPKISAAMSKITAARTRVNKRPEQTTEIERHNAAERMIMFSNLKREKHALRSFHGKVAAIPEEREEVKGMGVPRREANEAARKRLEEATAQLKNIRMNPMRGIAAALVAQTWTLTPDDPEAFDGQLLTLHVLCKLHDLNMALDELRFDCALTGRLDYAQALLTAKAIKEQFGTRQMLPERDVPRLKEMIEPMNAQLRLLCDRLEHYSKNPPPAEDADKVRDKFKEFLDTIDIRSTVGAIEIGLPKPTFEPTSYVLTAK